MESCSSSLSLLELSRVHSCLASSLRRKRSSLTCKVGHSPQLHGGTHQALRGVNSPRAVVLCRETRMLVSHGRAADARGDSSLGTKPSRDWTALRVATKSCSPSFAPKEGWLACCNVRPLTLSGALGVPPSKLTRTRKSKRKKPLY